MPFNWKSRHWQEKAVPLLLLLLLAWQIVLPVLRQSINQEPTPLDFQTYYAAAQRLAAGQTLYVIQNDGTMSDFIYSPFLPILMLPLTLLSIQNAANLWAGLNLCFLLAALWVYVRSVKLGWQHAASLGIVLLVSFLFRPTQTAFFLGQVNILLLLIVCGMYWAQHRTRDLWFGVMIAVAALLKPWFLLFFGYLALRRCWKAIGYGLGAFVISNAVLFTLIGWHQWSIYQQLLLKYSSQPWNLSDSFIGFARKHFAANRFVEPLIQSPQLFAGFVVGGFFLLLLGMVYLWRTNPGRSAYEDRLRLSFFISSVLLAMPLVHLFYFMFSLPLFWTILAPNLRQEPESRTVSPWTFGAFAVLCVAFMQKSLAPYAPGIPREGWGTLLMSSYFFMALSMWGLCWYLIAQARRQRVHAIPTLTLS